MASSEEQPPVPASLAASLGSPRCAFVTGGPREYWPGLSCIAARLAALGTAHPVLAITLALILAQTRTRARV